MNGSFNKIIVVKNKVIKIESVVDSFSENILNSLDNNHVEYYKDLKKIGIDVARLYFDKKILGKNIEVQEFIKGKSLASYMEDKNINIDDKLNMFKRLLIIYKKTLNHDVCIDLNMKNFIISGNRLVYIDLIPSIYKSKISKDNIDKDEYKNYYLNNNLAIANITNYLFRSFIHLSKNDLIITFKKLKIIVKELFDFNLDLTKNKKTNLLYEYIYTDMDYNQYEETYQKIKRM